MTEPHAMDAAGRTPPDGGAALGDSQLQFLATKVVPPRSRGLIERPRLLGMASQLSENRLVVVKAPAGFGKTSLAVIWRHALQQSGNTVAWLTIDSGDDEPPTFFFYVAHALQRACKEIGAAAIELIQESFLINPRAIVSSLINDLAEIDDEVYLFLEDYHWVANPTIHETLAFLLKNAPSHFHMVLTTRTEPPLPLASLRAQNDLLEINVATLRFDLKETQNFLETEKRGSLGASDLRLLHERTEGWPAALRIMASTPIQSRQDFGEYVRNLSGTPRTMGAYLEEVLGGLPSEMVQFMLRTAVLNRLCASLCEAVTGASTSREFLRSIEKRQLLLVPLDQEGVWYRYHPLLGEYLAQRLETELGNEIPGLHQRASQWYAGQELWTDAVQHALTAGDSIRALGWIKNAAMPLVKRGDLFTLLGWQRLFPSGLMRSQPEVRLAIAWGMALAVRCDEALELLDEIDRDMGLDHSSEGEVSRCECETIRSVAIALKDDSEAALSIAKDCIGQSSDSWTANVASNVVRFGHLKQGELKKFYATPWIPHSLDDDTRNVFASVYYRCIQGMAEAQQLRIPAADRYYLDALRLAEQHVGPNSVAAALPASLIARVRYEQGRLDEAEDMLIDRMPLISAGAMLDCVLSAYWVMARTAVHRVNLERANTLLEWAENQGNTRGWGRLSAAALFERARLCFNENRVEEGAEHLGRLERLSAEYPAPSNCAWSDIHRYTALARAYLAAAEQRFDEAALILQKLQRELENVRNLHFALRAETLLAIVRFKAEQIPESLASLGRVADAFAPAGIYRTILDEGTAVGPLLIAFQESVERAGGSPERMSYVSSLIAAWTARHRSTPAQHPIPAIPDGLSAREAGVLKLIAEGLSNKEIARSLAITPETVKSHVKHIFTKLNVEKRAQAVSRAQSLGLTGTRSRST